MASTPNYFAFRCNGTYGEASLGNFSEDTWMNSSDFFFPSNFVRSHSSNYVANHGDNSAHEFPFDCSFLGDASESEDLKISQDDYYKHDYEGTEKTISKPESISNPTSCSETDNYEDGTRRKMAHSRSERRYRENMNLKFLELEEVLSNRHCSQEKSPERMNRPTRTSILQQACDHILQLREEVKLLKDNLGILVETAFPDTHKYVLKRGR